MPPIHYRGDCLWERMERAVEKVRQRLERAARALEQAGVPYAVSGGNAGASWVAQVDEAAVRNTRDVDILLRHTDLPIARQALEREGFVYRHAASIDRFLDGPTPRLATPWIWSLRARKSATTISCPPPRSPNRPK